MKKAFIILGNGFTLDFLQHYFQHDQEFMKVEPNWGWAHFFKNLSKYQYDKITYSIKEFYTQYFSKNTNYEGRLKEYKDASSSRTRSATQRNNRMRSILGYCGIDI